MDGLKSKLTDIQTDAQDRQWRMVVLDFQELVNALGRNVVSELIKDVLKNEYGEWKIFSFLVSELNLSAMRAVASALDSGLSCKSRLGIMFCHGLYKGLEEQAKKIHEPPQYPPNELHWVSENSSAS